MTRPSTRHKFLPDYGPEIGPVGPAVVKRGQYRTCRGCNRQFGSRDAIGCYPTEEGHAKGLYEDKGQLRHKCPKPKKGS